MAGKYRVLVLAEAANPEWVSVPLVGWAMADALRAVADVHIVTQVRNAGAFTRAGLVEGRDFTSIDTENLVGPAYRFAERLRGGSGKGWTVLAAVTSLTYPYFEYLAWKRFGARIRNGEYDIVHRVTPLSPTTASPIAAKIRRAGVPFVLGPLNGGLPWPAGFGAERRKEKEWLSYVRGLYKLLPRRTRTLAAATVILAGSRHTAAEIPAAYADRIVYMPENGIEPSRFARVAEARRDGPLRVCFIGRLVPYKGPDIVIEAALPLLRTGRCRLDIIGDGPMRTELEALVDREGVRDAVTFHGWVEHNDVQTIACRSSVFAFPSVREFGGGVVLEAMALGLAPVVVDYGGPGELVAQGRGVAIPIGPRDTIVKAMRETLDRFAAAPEEVAAIGGTVRAWVLDRLTWGAKARAMLAVYDWATGARSDRPELY